MKITAYPANSIDTAVSAKATFRVKYAETMRDLTPANPKNPHNTVPAIYVSEANPDYGNPGMYRYEPTADYLVKANIGGWMLPDSSLVDGIPLKGEISGTQQILKYEPRRFSLAIKRHRKELKLVAVTHFHGKLDEITGSTILFASSCSEEDHHDEIDDFDIYRLTFSEDKLDTTINIWKKREGRGFNGESGPNDGFMEIVVLTEKTFDSLQISKIESQKQYDMLKKVAVWKLGDFVKNLDADDDVFHIPGKASDSIPFGSVELDTSCNPLYDERGFMQSTCEYTTDNYNPNRNLLHITFSLLF